MLLVGNYPPDQQRSMDRYAQLLFDGLREQAWDVRLIRPERVLNRLSGPQHGMAKWLGYLDKFLLFPLRLRRQLRRLQRRGPLVLHVCDHSNALYLHMAGELPKVLTCHDMLAVRSAMSEVPENPVRASGRLLQSMIRRSLPLADQAVCVSMATQADLLAVSSLPAARTSVIGLPPGDEFRPMARDEARQSLAESGILAADQGAYLLHVGADCWYKNRDGLLRIYHALKARREDAPALLIIGSALSPAQRAWLAERDLSDAVVCRSGLSAKLLRAAYAGADALLFPSVAEGFGWPVLEALACACPVAASELAPITEVGGDAVSYFDPRQPAEAASVIDALLDESSGEAEARRQRALRRAEEASKARFVAAFTGLYRDLIGPPDTKT